MLPMCLFYAQDAQPKAGKVVKFATRYDCEVPQALYHAGLAPALYEVEHLQGGFIQVSCSFTPVNLSQAYSLP